MAKTTDIKYYWYVRGQRRCPVCCVQLVWKGHKHKPNVSNLATREHIIAGKSDAYENSIITCHSCNNKRGNMCLIKFAKQMKAPNIEFFERKVREARDYINMTRSQKSQHNSKKSNPHKKVWEL